MYRMLRHFIFLYYNNLLWWTVYIFQAKVWIKASLNSTWAHRRRPSCGKAWAQAVVPSRGERCRRSAPRTAQRKAWQRGAGGAAPGLGNPAVPPLRWLEPVKDGGKPSWLFTCTNTCALWANFPGLYLLSRFWKFAFIKSCIFNER